MRTLNAVSVQTIQLLSQLRSLHTPGTWTALPRQCGNRAEGRRAAPAGGPFHLLRMGAASRNSSAGPGTSPRVCVAPTGPGLPSWLPSRLPSSPSVQGQPLRPPASTAGALRAQALRAAPAPYRGGSGGRPSPPPPLAGPRSPLSPPASASSSARALGAAATSPQVRPVAGGRCNPAERGWRGAGAPRTGSVGSSNPAALV